MTVGARIVVGPIGIPLVPVAKTTKAAEAAKTAGRVGIHHAGEYKFRRLFVVGGELEVAILHAGIFAEFLLEGPQRRGKNEGERDGQELAAQRFHSYSTMATAKNNSSALPR